MKRITAVLLLVCVVIGVTACGDDDEGVSSGAPDNLMSFTEDEYSYAVDGEAKAGTVTFAVDNVGKEFHMLGICELKDGKTVADVQEAAKSDSEDAFGQVCVEETAIDGLGGGATPGSKYEITATGVQAGSYVALCFLPDKDGRPHFTRGMIKGFEIGEGHESGDIEGDVTYTATKEKLEGPTKVHAGDTTIKFGVEKGAPDEFLLLKLKDGKTPDDVDKFFDAMDEGGFYTDADSPVSFLYFAFDDTKDRSIKVDLTPGKWVIVANDSDSDSEDIPPDEDPHAIQFTVS